MQQSDKRETRNACKLVKNILSIRIVTMTFRVMCTG